MVTLREVSQWDVEKIISITTYNRIPSQTNEEAWEKILKIKHDYNQGNCLHWGIIDNSTNQIIGTCGFYRGFSKKRGEIGCVLLPDFRGKGFMKEALKLVVEYGYQVLELKEIFALTNKNNIIARKLLERLNFSFIKYVNDEDIELIHNK